MKKSLINILEQMHKLANQFVEMTGLEDTDCNGDYETPKMPKLVNEIDPDILSDISCIKGDLDYFFGG